MYLKSVVDFSGNVRVWPTAYRYGVQCTAYTYSVLVRRMTMVYWYGVRVQRTGTAYEYGVRVWRTGMAYGYGVWVPVFHHRFLEWYLFLLSLTTVYHRLIFSNSTTAMSCIGLLLC